jgi:phage gpG-like protein
MNGNEIKKYVETALEEFKSKALAIMEVEAIKSIKKNFDEGGRPKWIPSKKKGKAKGTKTLVITGQLKNVIATSNLSESSVTISTHPETRAYARIHHFNSTLVRLRR